MHKNAYETKTTSDHLLQQRLAYQSIDLAFSMCFYCWNTLNLPSLLVATRFALETLSISIIDLNSQCRKVEPPPPTHLLQQQAHISWLMSSGAHEVVWKSSIAHALAHGSTYKPLFIFDLSYTGHLRYFGLVWGYLGCLEPKCAQFLHFGSLS